LGQSSLDMLSALGTGGAFRLLLWALVLCSLLCVAWGGIAGEHEKHLLYTSHNKDHHHEHHAYNAEHYLLLGAETGNLAQVKYAIERGADVNARNNAGVSSIIWASNNGHVDIVKYLLSKGALVNDKSNNLRTTLMWACFWGHDKVVELLLNEGANYKVYDEDAMTPLMAAAYSGNRDIIDMLLEKPGLVITDTNHFDGTALTIARAHAHKEVIEILEPYFAGDEHSDNLYVLLWNVLWADVRILYQTLKRELRRHGILPASEEL